MLLTYATKEAQKDRVREVGPAWQMAVARAAIGVGRVRQARERTLEVEEKDAVPRRVDSRYRNRARQRAKRVSNASTRGENRVSYYYDAR